MEQNILEFCFKEKIQREKDYLKIVDTYITYYHMRAQICKRRFYIGNIIRYFVLAVIPIIQIIGGIDKYPWAATISSSTCLFIEALLRFLRAEEKWILYRSTNNALMSEKRKYLTLEENYKDIENPFGEFVKQVESIIDDEAHKWVTTFKEKKGDD